MSGWDGWVKKIMVGSDGQPSATKAGIFDVKGKPWKVTPGDFKIPPAFFANAATAMSKGTGAVSKLEIPGFPNFMVLRADGNTVIAKCKDAGVTVSKAKTCFVVGLYDNASVSPGNNTKQTEQVREDLQKAGY